MRYGSTLVFIFCLVVFLAAGSIAFAADDPEDDGDDQGRDDGDDEKKDTPPEPPVKGDEPEKPVEPVKPEPPETPVDETKDEGEVVSPLITEVVLKKLPADQPHWFNIFWRSGMGFVNTDLRIKYRGNKSGHDEFDSEGSGNGDIHVASCWFYPATKKNFFLSLDMGGGSQNGHFFNDEKKNEFLNGKEYWSSYFIMPVGIGYRWLVGSGNNVSINLRGDGYPIFFALHMEGEEDGIDTFGGGAGLMFGVHYRYENGLLLGGALELRQFATKRTDTEILDELVDMNYEGSMLLLSFVIGWEPRYETVMVTR